MSSGQKNQSLIEYLLKEIASSGNNFELKKMDMLEECSSMTNVTIVCSDGLFHTHKIVVASASDFIKTLLSDIPVGDEVTLYLPDHDKPSIVQLLDDTFLPTLQNSPAPTKDVFGYQLLKAKVF